MSKLRTGNYGADVTKRKDGRFQVIFLYNMNNPTSDFSNGDVSDIKNYKSEKMAIKKAEQYIATQNA